MGTLTDNLTEETEIDAVSARLSSPWAVVALVTAAFWVISAIGLIIYTADARRPTVREWVIPAGAALAIAEGANPLELPSTWDFYAGDGLVIRNDDNVTHSLGLWSIPPGVVFEVELQPVLAGALVCTLHPSGSISLDVQPSGFDWRQTMFPTFAFGPLLGLIVIGVRRLMGALGDPEDRTNV